MTAIVRIQYYSCVEFFFRSRISSELVNLRIVLNSD